MLKVARMPVLRPRRLGDPAPSEAEAPAEAPAGASADTTSPEQQEEASPAQAPSGITFNPRVMLKVEKMPVLRPKRLGESKSWEGAQAVADVAKPVAAQAETREAGAESEKAAVPKQTEMQHQKEALPAIEPPRSPELCAGA